MSELLNKILQFMEHENWGDDMIRMITEDTYVLSQAIAVYAHDKQLRPNGELYVMHPHRLMLKYYNYIGTTYEDSRFDVELLEEYNIPFYGVVELCLLHDVIEDTELTLEDIESLFIECGYEDYFINWIKKPLELITHDKSEEYPMYIFKCSLTPQSALVKMLDMQDNCNMFSLDTFSKENLERSQNYLGYMYALNEKYHFVEN